MTNATIAIEGRRIGAGEPPYIVAEVSANHNGSLDRAKAIITMASERGADAVKLQTYTPEMMTLDSDREEFRIKHGLWKGHTLYTLYERAQTPLEWQSDLFEHARSLGMTIFSSPFDETAVDLLEALDAPAYKIASFEAVDLPLIARVARTGKPLILSTGMADLSEIADAIACATEHGCEQLILLHCVSAYPAPVDQANLRTISDMSERFEVPVGLSDHTLGTAVSVGGVALGAVMVEKHVTLDRRQGGLDAPFSLEPDELERLVTDAKQAWAALGRPNYERLPAEQANATLRRSIFVVREVREGEAITRENVRVIRPGHGLAPKYYEAVLGARATRALQRGEPLTAADVTPAPAGSAGSE